MNDKQDLINLLNECKEKYLNLLSFETIADYLIEKGVKRIPFKPGDEVYFVDRLYENKITKRKILEVITTNENTYVSLWPLKQSRYLPFKDVFETEEDAKIYVGGLSNITS